MCGPPEIWHWWEVSQWVVEVWLIEIGRGWRTNMKKYSFFLSLEMKWYLGYLSLELWWLWQPRCLQQNNLFFRAPAQLWKPSLPCPAPRPRPCLHRLCSHALCATHIPMLSSADQIVSGDLGQTMLARREQPALGRLPHVWCHHQVLQRNWYSKDDRFTGSR